MLSTGILQSKRQDLWRKSLNSQLQVYCCLVSGVIINLNMKQALLSELLLSEVYDWFFKRNSNGVLSVSFLKNLIK
jgi:hypothetical protein